MPVQWPASAPSGWPAVAGPGSVGGAVLTGGAATTAIGAETLDVAPAALVAVTTTRTVPPTSAAVGV